MNCSNTNEYMCLPDERFEELFEFCYDNPRLLVLQGKCVCVRVCVCVCVCAFYLITINFILYDFFLFQKAVYFWTDATLTLKFTAVGILIMVALQTIIHLLKFINVSITTIYKTIRLLVKNWQMYFLNKCLNSVNVLGVHSCVFGWKKFPVTLIYR